MRIKALLATIVLVSMVSAIHCFAQETGEVADAAVEDTTDVVDTTDSEDDSGIAMPLEGTTGISSAGATLLAGAMMMPLIIGCAVSLLVIVSWIRIFSKAGLPGIGAIVPIWNVILFCKAAGKPGWWFLLLCIPGVNIIIGIIVTMSLAAQFGKGAGFGLGLVFLPVIFYPILAFGGARPGGMELPETDAAGDGAPATRPTTGATVAAGQPVQVQGGSYTIAAWLAIIATLCFLALLLFQYLEYSYYGSHDPRHGLGSVWPAKIAAPPPQP